MKTCSTPICRRKAQHNRSICRSCRTERERSDLARYCYRNLVKHAKERGIEMSLTLEQFREFCVKTNYLSRKGRNKDSLHIDRRDERFGYHDWNIQVLPNTDNVRKALQWRYSTTDKQMQFWFKTWVEPTVTGCPF